MANEESPAILGALSLYRQSAIEEKEFNRSFMRRKNNSSKQYANKKWKLPMPHEGASLLVKKSKTPVY